MNYAIKNKNFGSSKDTKDSKLNVHNLSRLKVKPEIVRKLINVYQIIHLKLINLL